MQHVRPLRRSLLLVLSLLSACGASVPSVPGASGMSGVVSVDARVSAETPRVRRRPPSPAPSGALLIGRFAASEGDLNMAAQAYQRALGADMENVELRRQAFVTSLLAGRPEAERLAGLLGRDHVAQLVLAGRDALAGAWSKAEARYAALPRGDGAADLLRPLLLAWAQAGRGQTDQALATLQPQLEQSELRAFYALHGALIADLANRRSVATRLYNTARTEYGGSGHLQLARQIASFQARQGDRAGAEATLREMAENSEEMMLALPRLVAEAATGQVRGAADGLAEAYLVVASVMGGQNSRDSALLLTRLALQLNGELTGARLLGAELLASGKRPEGALELLAGVAEADPLHPVVEMRRARLLARLERGDEALAILERLARAHPDRPEPSKLSGDILRVQRKFAEAVVAYDRAMALIGTPERRHWAMFYDRGVALERSRQWERAEADFQRALDFVPEQPHVLNYLGYSWADQGRNLERAREMIARAVRQRPNDGAMVDSLGWVAMRQGHVAEAVELLERAVELESRDPTINGHLGDAYWADGRQLEALYQWRRALGLKPDPDEKARVEGRLREAERALGITP